MKSAITIFLIISMLVGACGCSKKPAAKKPIKIATEVWAGYSYAYLAQEKGFFKKNGVEVQLVQATDSMKARKMFADGDVDGRFDVFTEAVTGYAQGIVAQVVWVVDYSDSADVVVAKKGINSLEQLKGKRIGVEGMNTFSHMTVLELLRKHGLREQDVRFEIVNPQKVLDAIESNNIDAGHTWEPTTSKALAKGCKIVAKAGEVPGLITDVLFIDPKVVSERRQEVKAIVKSLNEAIEYSRKNQDESYKIMAKNEGMTVKQLTSDLSGLHILDLAENAQVMQESNSPQSIYAASERISNFFMNRGQIMTIPKAKDLIEPSFVKELSGEK